MPPIHTPVEIADRLRDVSGRLVALLRTLEPDDWHRPTVSSERDVKDIAREYTEKWHHTQQIFEATSRESTITERRLFHPCLDIFLRALPFTYRAVNAAPGTLVRVTITGPAGGAWALLRADEGWLPVTDTDTEPTAHVILRQNSAWKLFTRRHDRDTARTRFPDIQIEGDIDLGGHVLEMVSVVA